MVVDHGGASRRRFGHLAVIAAVGVPDATAQLVQPAFSEFDLRAYEEASCRTLTPGITNLYRQIVRQGWVTARRSEIADDAAYYAAPHYHKFRKQINADDYVVSIRLVDVPRRGRGDQHRPPARRPALRPREVALMKLLHDESRR